MDKHSGLFLVLYYVCGFKSYTIYVITKQNYVYDFC